MSEVHTPPAAAAASLYPEDGGAAAAAAATQTAGAAGADTIAGAAGADTVASPGPSDTLTGGAGADTVAGGDTGTSTEAAAAGNDTISGEAGADSLTADSYKFTLPEGLTADAGLQTEARTAMLEAGVKPEKAQALVDLFGKALKAGSDAATAAHNTEQAGWLKEVAALPEFQGPTRETSLQAIGKLFDEYGTPEAKAALDRGGIGNNPALAKMFVKMANALAEGGPTPGGRPAPNGQGGKRQPTTVGQSLYPDAG